MDPIGKNTLVIDDGIVPALGEGIERQEVVVGKLVVEGVIPPLCYQGALALQGVWVDSGWAEVEGCVESGLKNELILSDVCLCHLSRDRG